MYDNMMFCGLCVLLRLNVRDPQIPNPQSRIPDYAQPLVFPQLTHL